MTSFEEKRFYEMVYDHISGMVPLIPPQETGYDLLDIVCLVDSPRKFQNTKRIRDLFHVSLVNLERGNQLNFCKIIESRTSPKKLVVTNKETANFNAAVKFLRLGGSRNRNRSVEISLVAESQKLDTAKFNEEFKKGYERKFQKPFPRDENCLTSYLVDRLQNHDELMLRIPKPRQGSVTNGVFGFVNAVSVGKIKGKFLNETSTDSGAGAEGVPATLDVSAHIKVGQSADSDHGVLRGTLAASFFLYRVERTVDTWNVVENVFPLSDKADMKKLSKELFSFLRLGRTRWVDKYEKSPHVYAFATHSAFDYCTMMSELEEADCAIVNDNDFSSISTTTTSDMVFEEEDGSWESNYVAASMEITNASAVSTITTVAAYAIFVLTFHFMSTPTTAAGYGDDHFVDPSPFEEQDPYDFLDQLTEIVLLPVGGIATPLYDYQSSYNILVKAPKCWLSSLFAKLKKQQEGEGKGIDLQNGWQFVSMKPAFRIKSFHNNDRCCILPIHGSSSSKLGHPHNDHDQGSAPPPPAGILRHEPGGVSLLIPIAATTKKESTKNHHRVVTSNDTDWIIRTDAHEVRRDDIPWIERLTRQGYYQENTDDSSSSSLQAKTTVVMVRQQLDHVPMGEEALNKEEKARLATMSDNVGLPSSVEPFTLPPGDTWISNETMFPLTPALPDWGHVCEVDMESLHEPIACRSHSSSDDSVDNKSLDD